MSKSAVANLTLEWWYNNFEATEYTREKNDHAWSNWWSLIIQTGIITHNQWRDEMKIRNGE